jgi:hypothetical protein
VAFLKFIGDEVINIIYGRWIKLTRQRVIAFFAEAPRYRKVFGEVNILDTTKLTKDIFMAPDMFGFDYMHADPFSKETFLSSPLVQDVFRALFLFDFPRDTDEPDVPSKYRYSVAQNFTRFNQCYSSWTETEPHSWKHGNSGNPFLLACAFVSHV